MARRKQEVQLQQEIETAEEWEEMIAKEGLWVVDVYQEWCGPCAAMVANFRRLKNELGDDLLHFAAAKADTVDSLEKYRGRCEPCFLFFAGGVLVAFVHGANSPVILRTIMEQLKAEHKVIDGNGERKEVKDPLISNLEEREKAQYDEEENEKEEEEKKGFTVAIIKPDVVRDGKVDEILQQMEEAGIEILEKQERQLTEEEARTFYDHLKDEEYFNDLVEFMSSGPSCVLVLTKGQKGDTVIKEWRDLIGPTNVDEAKDKAPESLRAKYGTEKCMNALHGSDSPECAAREMAFFFPDMATPTIPAPGSQPQLQRTMALIRPDAFGKNKDEIMEKIKEAGFKVALQKEMTLTEDQAKEFYKEHTDKPYFDELIARMTSGPLMALGLAREDAVSEWRKVLGPTTNAKEEAPDSLRAQFSIDESSINQLHGSDSIETAEKEIQHFFPMEQTVAAIKPDAFSTKDEIIAKIHEAGFRIAARKETTITKEIAEEFYGEHKGKEYFDDLVGHMTSGPTMFMVLSREDAVSGWREVIGPTNPEQAQTEAPESLRAIYGKDILLNALHGSSDVDHAKSTIEQVFGHLEFKPDGNLEESEPTKDQDEPAVEETQAEANDVAPEFRQEGTEEESGETKQETSEDNAEGGTAQGEDGVKKEEEEEPPKPEGEEAAKPEGEEAAKPEGEEAAKPEGEEAQAQSEQTESEQPKDEGEAQAKGESGEEAQANQETTESQSKTDQEGVTEQKSEERPASEAKEEDKTDDSKGEDAKEGDVKDGENKAEDKAEEEQKGEDASKAAEESEKKEEEAKQEEDTKEEDAKKDDETKTEQKEETKSEEQQAST